MYYRVCPDCGAHLDPDERCDCILPAAMSATDATDSIEKKQRPPRCPGTSLY